MPEILIETQIHAPAERCFDLMRDIWIHTETTMETDERAVAGVTEGMIGPGQTVTFEGKHFGFKQRLTVRVTEFERPTLFVDEMTEGNFRSFKHIHEFVTVRSGTLMRDRLIWTSPFGIVGRIVDELLLKRHLRDLVSKRNLRLKQLAEQRPA